MKHLFTLLALTIGFSINAQVSTNNTSPSGTNSSAIGDGTTASGLYSTAMGSTTTASGNGSTAMGKVTTASDYLSLVIGQYNLSGEMEQMVQASLMHLKCCLMEIPQRQVQ